MFERAQSRFIDLLRWSERYTKTDMVYLFQGGFWLSLGYGIQIISGFILTVVFANTLSKEDLGIYQFIISASAILAMCTLGGMSEAIARIVARGNDGVLRSGFHAKLVWSTGIVFISALIALYYLFNERDALAIGFLFIGAFVPLLESFKLYQSFFVGKKFFREIVTYGAWRKPIPVIALLATLIFTHNPITLVFVYFASHTLTTGLLYVAVVKRYKLPYSTDMGMIRYSKHLSLMAFFERTAMHADQILIFIFLGPVSVAAFALAQMPIVHMHTLLKKMRLIAAPKLAVRDFLAIQKTLPRKVGLLMLGTTIMTGVYVILAPTFFNFLFPLYPESIPISQALAITFIATPLLLYNEALVAHEKKRPLYILRVGAPVLKILLLLILIPQFDIVGAVSALVIADLVTGAISTFYFRSLRA